MTAIYDFVSELESSWDRLAAVYDKVNFISYLLNLRRSKTENRSQTLFKQSLFSQTYYKTIKDSDYQLLEINRLHHITILSKSWKGMELISSLHNRTKNKLKMFNLIRTKIWLPRIFKKQSKV